MTPHKKHYEKYKREHKCQDCGIEIDGRKVTCDKCQSKQQIARNKLRYSRIENRLCTKCGSSNICNPYKVQTLRNPDKQNKEVMCLKCYLKKTSLRFLGISNRWQELLDLFNKQEGKCAYTGELLEIGKTASVDHIVPCMGGNNKERITTIENLQWVSLKINYMKRELSEEEFLDLCQKVSNLRK